MHCSVTWTPVIGPVYLIVYNASSTVIGQASGSSGLLSVLLSSLAPGTYKVKVQNGAGSTITDALTVVHQ